MSAQHLQGPWIVGEEDGSDFFLVGPDADDGYVVAPVVRVHDEELANLIAAAPELLAALEDLTLNVREAMKTGGWVPTPLHASFWEAVSNGISAIDKATGQQGGAA